MRRLLILMLVLLGGCSGLLQQSEGELRIRNRTNSDIWISVSDSEPKHLESLSTWSKYYTSYEVKNLSYTGNLVFPNKASINVRPGLVSSFDVQSDGGAIQLTNTGTATIIEVYLSSSDESNWGMNDLGGTIEPGSDKLWSVTEGTWDIMIVDDTYATQFVYDQPVTINQITSIPTTKFDNTKRKLKQYLTPVPKAKEATQSND